MRRRQAGISGLARGREAKARAHEQQSESSLMWAQESYRTTGDEIAAVSMQQMRDQLQRFEEKLGVFARDHKHQINKDPEFRAHFQTMCASVGVDPLASAKSFWGELLGIGDFYYELGVQIIETCLATRAQNGAPQAGRCFKWAVFCDERRAGGLMAVSDLRQRLENTRGRAAIPVTEDDVERSIAKLRVLGSGFDVRAIGQRAYVQSVPVELSGDHTACLAAAESTAGHTSVSALQAALSWDGERAAHVLDHLLREGFAWIDEQGGERDYWFPALSPWLR